MSNTMPINIPQPDLRFQWVAIYNDGSELKQNYLTPDEHHFGHIDQANLQEFYLEDSQGNREYGVNVSAGYIYCKGLKLYLQVPYRLTQEYRLIYFRRVRNDYTSGDLTSQTVRHVIGLQATIDGVNRQQLLFVGEDDKLELGQVK